MNINNTSQITELLHLKLKQEFTYINWAVYPNNEELNQKHLPIAYCEITSIEYLEATSDVNIIELGLSLRLLYSDET